MTPWAHQDRYHDGCRDLFRRGVRTWNVEAPCGAGKTYIMMRLAMNMMAKGFRVTMYCCRNQALSNLKGSLDRSGIPHGMVAAEYPREEDEEARLQLCSLQTVAARLGDFRHRFPFADFVLVDEAHQQTGEMAEKVFKKHEESGVQVRIGFTATPVNLGGLYEENLRCVRFEELRRCKAHLRPEHYGPDRPDLSKLKVNKSGEFSTSDNERVNAIPQIFCNVLENYRKLNPLGLPAICFCASVAHSRGMAWQFAKAGISCASVDSERVLLSQKTSSGSLEMVEYPSTLEFRETAINGSREGKYKVLCNRFVLRESVDMPWLYHAIIACSMGGISTYLQSVGRVLRWWPDYDRVVIQDHGGNIDRHGLVDEEDRDWRIGDTNKTYRKRQVAKQRATQGAEAEPICCPKCTGMRLGGPQCPYCGHMHQMSVRVIRQLDGKMVRKRGRIEKYKAPKIFDDYYRSALYACYYKGGSVKQAYKIATLNAEKAGVTDMRLRRIWAPPQGDERWSYSTREVYPDMQPRNRK